MGLDNAAHQRQPQAYARDGGLGRAAREGLEQRLHGQVWRQAGPAILHGHKHLAVLFACVDGQRRAGRRVLGGVVQQVDQHALHEHGIELQQRQAGGHVGTHGMLVQARAHLAQRAADHFIQRQPFALQVHAALLQARHVQQVLHQSLHGLGLDADLLQHVGCAARRHMALRGLGRAQDGGQRRAQVVRDGRQQGVAHALALHGDLGLLGHGHEVLTLQRQRHLAGTRLQQALLLGHLQALGRTQLQHQYAPHAHGRRQRHVAGRRGRQRVRALAGLLTVVHGPARNAVVHGAGAAAGGAQALVGIGQQQPGLGVEHARDRAQRNLHHLLLRERARKVARQPRQRPRAARARPPRAPRGAAAP
ncbi:hypothetical protein GY14_12305 [Delftia tsuruhatensis]|nr:hypothetical protein GY14_12305 [Delftia tsuruhatensis]